MKVSRTNLVREWRREEFIAELGQRGNFARFRDNRLHVAVGREDAVDPGKWHGAA